MKESERLRAAKALIADRTHWIRGNYCDGEDIDRASCFCSLGAVKKVRGESVDSPDKNSTTWYLRTSADRISSGEYDVAGFNDSKLHAEVMAMWDLAIELAEKDEGK